MSNITQRGRFAHGLANAWKAWQNLDPGGVGEAVAGETLVVMAQRLRERNDPAASEAALFIETAFDTYCRQQDLFQLLVEDVTILEQDLASKGEVVARYAAV